MTKPMTWVKENWKGTLSVLSVVLGVVLLTLAIYWRSESRARSEAATKAAVEYQAKQNARIEALAKDTQTLSRQQLALTKHVAEIVSAVKANGDSVRGIASENARVLEQVVALNDLIRTELAHSRTENEELHQRLLELQQETQLAALKALRESQAASPTTPPVVSNDLLDRLIKLLSSPPKKGKK